MDVIRILNRGLAAAVVLATATLAAAQDGPSELVVQATAFESDEGKATIVLINSEAAFQAVIEQTGQDRAAWKSHFSVADVAIQNGAAAVRFPELPPGQYAVVAFHDANQNQRLDKNWAGMPKEDLGVSNDYRPSGFPPRRPTWNDIKFSVTPGANRKDLKIGMMR